MTCIPYTWCHEKHFSRQYVIIVLRLSWNEELFNQVTEEALFVTSGYQVQAGRLSNVMDEQMTAAQEMTHQIIRLFMLCCTVVVFPTHSLCFFFGG